MLLMLVFSTTLGSNVHFWDFILKRKVCRGSDLLCFAIQNQLFHFLFKISTFVFFRPLSLETPTFNLWKLRFSLFRTLWYETYTFFYSYHISLFFLPLSYETVTFAPPFFSHFSFCLPLWYDTHTFFWSIFITWAILLIFSNTLVRNGHFFMFNLSVFIGFVTTLARNAYFQFSCSGLIPFFITTLVRFAYSTHLSCTFLSMM